MNTTFRDRYMPAFRAFYETHEHNRMGRRRYRPDVIRCRDCDLRWDDCDCDLGMRHTVLGQTCDCSCPYPPAHRPDLQPRLVKKARDTACFWIPKRPHTPPYAESKAPASLDTRASAQ